MKLQRFVVMVVPAAVSIAVVAGLWLAGSPAKQRLVRLDERRLADLRSLVRPLDRHLRDNDALPEALAALVDGRILSRLPVDPETAGVYEYRRLTPDTYELCARFSLPSPEQDGADFWSHAAGRQCFELEAGQPR